MTAPAGTPFQIEFDNKDASVPHNVVDPPIAAGAEVFKGEIFPGPAKRVYDVPGARRRDVRLRLHRPSEHDRHVDGPVREPRWRRPR